MRTRGAIKKNGNFSFAYFTLLKRNKKNLNEGLCLKSSALHNHVNGCRFPAFAHESVYFRVHSCMDLPTSFATRSPISRATPTSITKKGYLRSYIDLCCTLVLDLNCTGKIPRMLEQQFFFLFFFEFRLFRRVGCKHSMNSKS